MSNKVYDTLKFTALVVLPLAGSLYFGFGQIWNFPLMEEVMGSIAVLDTALGVLIGKLSKENIMGSFIVKQDEEGVPVGMRIEANRDPMILNDKSTVTFQVKRELSV